MRRVNTVLFIAATIILAVILSRVASTPRSVSLAPATNTPRAVAQVASRTATPTRTTAAPQSALNTPQPTFTPSRTLKPPPTFEPATLTLPPSLTPSVSPTPTLNLSVNIPGLQGVPTNTPIGGATACAPRKDWKLTYTVQRGDALARIADQYGTSVDELVAGNCLQSADKIVIGQVLEVPGTTQPYQPEVACIPFELLTPFNGSLNVPGGGTITFDWRGPRAPRNLIRIKRPDGSLYEDVVELRQNEQIDIYTNLPAAGLYTWWVYPLDSNFVQACPEGGPWTFTKAQAPTATPTSKAGGGGLGGLGG